VIGDNFSKRYLQPLLDLQNLAPSLRCATYSNWPSTSCAVRISISATIAVAQNRN